MERREVERSEQRRRQAHRARQRARPSSRPPPRGPRRSKTTLEQAHNAAFAADNEVRAHEAEIARAKDRIEAPREPRRCGAGEQIELAEQKPSALETERDEVETQLAALEAEEARRGRSCSRASTSGSTNAARRGARRRRERRRASHATAQAQSQVAAAEAKLAGLERRTDEMRAARGEARARARSSAHGDAELARAPDGSSRAASTSSARQGHERGGTARRARAAARRASPGDRRERARPRQPKQRARARSARACMRSTRCARASRASAPASRPDGTKDPTLLGLVADRVEAPAELTAALAALLGSRCEDVVVRRRRARRRSSRASSPTRRRAARRSSRAHRAVRRGPAAERALEGRGVDRAAARRASLRRRRRGARRAIVGDAIVVEDAHAALSASRACRRVERRSSRSTARSSTPTAACSGGTGEEVAAGMLDVRSARCASSRESCRGSTSGSTEQARDAPGAARLRWPSGAALERARQRGAPGRARAGHGREGPAQKPRSSSPAVRKRRHRSRAELDELVERARRGGHERARGRARRCSKARATLARREAEIGEARGAAPPSGASR